MATGKLTGKTALITGAESGIGQGIAAEFAAEGADVIITYLTDEAAARQTLAMVQQAGGNGTVLQCDVTDPENVAGLFSAALHIHPQINILVNCAGVRSTDKYLHEVSFAEFEHTIKTNLFGVFLCCQQFVKHRLQQSGPARIINITSIHEQVVSAGKTDYCASKSAVGGFSKALAMEVADKQITVNNIAPGMVLTQMNQRAMDNIPYRRELEQRIPAKIAGTPQDVAKAAVFLASDDAAYITGTTQIIDGGLSLNRAPGAQ